MRNKKEILHIETLEAFKRLINLDSKSYDLDLMVSPGTLEDEHGHSETIPALRRPFPHIYLLLEGEHDIKLGARQAKLSPNDLVIVPQNMLYASDYVKNCRGYCLHFKPEFLEEHLDHPLTDEFPYLHTDARHIINLSEEESTLIQNSFRDILSEYDNFSPDKAAHLWNNIVVLLLRIREIYRSRLKAFKRKGDRTHQLAHGFKLLVEKHFIENHSVNHYADMLDITPRHLSEVVHEILGRPPLQVIHDLLFLEAKAQLRSTDKSLSEIAEQLRFDDLSHFSHFIKNRCGVTPHELRKML